jgi:hypothetical protein
MTTTMNCECKVCVNYDDFLNHEHCDTRSKTTFPIVYATRVKPDKHVVMWRAGTYCTITSCKAFALKTQAHEDYISLWQDWLKTQIEENVPVRNILRHPFCATENIPTVEWLKNDDNFHLLRSYLLLHEDYTLDLHKDDKFVNEEAIMKYIYGLYHYATIRVCFNDIQDLPYNLNREMKLLDIYYNWEIDDMLKKRIPDNDYDLGEFEHQQWKQNTKETKSEFPERITLKMN